MNTNPKVILPGAAPEIPEPRKGSIRDTISIIGVSQIGLFVLAAVYAIYHSKPVLLPLVLALLVTMVLKPVHGLLCRAGLPTAMASATVIICLLWGLFAAGFRLANPATEWLDAIDMETAEVRFKEVFAPIQKAQHEFEEVVKKVDKMTDGGQAAPGDDGGIDGGHAAVEGEESAEAGLKGLTSARDRTDAATATEHGGQGTPGKDVRSRGEELVLTIAAVKGGDRDVSNTEDGTVEVEADALPISVSITDEPVNIVYEYIQEFGVHAAATIILIFFFLAFGDAMQRRMSEDEATAELVGSIAKDVSWYLFMISAINSGLGLVIGLALWILGTPNPVLWGLMAAVLNFIPYVGALIGTAIVFVVAMVSLDDVGMSFVVPAVYFFLTALEGNFVTPTIIGKRFTLNPIVVVVWFLSWGALWGIPGMLIATPTLMAVKIFCASVEALGRVDRIISV